MRGKGDTDSIMEGDAVCGEKAMRDTSAMEIFHTLHEIWGGGDLL